MTIQDQFRKGELLKGKFTKNEFCTERVNYAHKGRILELTHRTSQCHIHSKGELDWIRVNLKIKSLSKKGELHKGEFSKGESLKGELCTERANSVMHN